MENINKELRQEYLKAVRQYRYYRTMRQATLDVLKKGISLKVPTNYSKLDIKELYEKGTYRIKKVNGVYQRTQYVGLDAIRLQLISLKHQTSATYRKEIFIENYMKAMEKTGYTIDEREQVKNKLRSMSAQRLYLAIDSADFPSIDYTYANKGIIKINKLLEKIDRSVVKITNEQKLKIKERYKVLLPQYAQDIKGFTR